MNLALVDPFVLAQDCPEALTGKLHSGHATAIRFSHRGDLLASGRSDGGVVIFDIETNGLARKLNGHIRQIQSLSWSANDRYLLSSSQDCKCILWDLQDGSKLRVVKFEAPIFIAELHPRTTALFEEQPILVDVLNAIPKKSTLPSAPKRSEVDRENATEKQLAQDAKQTSTVTVFSPSGDHIFAGTNKGWLNVIDTQTHQSIHSSRVTSNIVIMIRLIASGRRMVVNSSDRVIRTVHVPDLEDEKLDIENIRLEVEHKFQDVVNRLSWNYVSCNSTGEYVTASTYMNHDIYVWETGRGSLVKILEGPKEELSVVEWHPHRPFVAAVGVETGRVYLWSILTPQRWSALAPDFAEVEENVEYVEHEDEFDIQPIEAIHKRRLDQEDEDVDVLTVEPSKAEFEPGEFQMPILLDIEQSDSEDEFVAVGAGQYRRRSPGAGKDWNDGEGSGDDKAGGVGTKRRRGQ